MQNPRLVAITDAQQAAPNLLNYRVGSNAAIPGSYTGSIYTAGTYATTTAFTQGFNQVMMQQAEHFDPFIQRALIEQPRFWYDRIARGAYPNFQGSEQETRIFRGGLTEYAGISGWSAIDPNPTSLNNPCAVGPYTTPKYAWERLQWSGFKRYWGSDPICSESLRFVDQAIQQLAWILEVGAEYGISIQEVWNRDWLLKTSVDNDRSFIMTSSYVGNSTAPRFYYEPRCKFVAPADFAAETHTYKVSTAYASSPFIVFPADVEVEPLNFDVLDALHESLDVRCRGSAIGNEGGRPVYGLPISALDFERYIKGNAYEVANWRESRSEKLIQGYDLGVKTHRAWGIMNDGNQLRFKITRFYAAGTFDAANYAGVGQDLEDAGVAVFIAEYVAPRVAGRLGENSQPIPEDNPAYFTAELAVMPILMNNVFTNLMGTPLNSLGSGTYFGPQAGLNGKWSWVNVVGPNNEEGNTGNFRGKFEIFPKPENSVVHSTSFLYRRCAESIRSRCPVDNSGVDPDTATGAVLAASYTAADANTIAGASVTITPTLLGKVTDVGVGTAVTLNVTGAAAATLTGYVISSASAPTYTVVIPLSGAVKLANAATSTYYIDGAVLKYRNGEDVVSSVVLTSIQVA